MEFRAQRAHLDQILDWVETEAAKAHLNQRAVREIRLACEEALVNVIDHAYKGLPDRMLSVECLPKEHQLQVVIRDSGRPFDPRTAPQPDTGASIDERRIGGLGIFMLRQLVDGMDYHRQQDQNILTLVKKG
jgi:anti-sigma regulatory factor (Ser/Thr protein kinase)